jgi:hypothetical protein
MRIDSNNSTSTEFLFTKHSMNTIRSKPHLILNRVILEHNAAGFQSIPKQNVNAQYKHN